MTCGSSIKRYSSKSLMLILRRISYIKICPSKRLLHYNLAKLLLMHPPTFFLLVLPDAGQGERTGKVVFFQQSFPRSTETLFDLRSSLDAREKRLSKRKSRQLVKGEKTKFFRLLEKDSYKKFGWTWALNRIGPKFGWRQFWEPLVSSKKDSKGCTKKRKGRI